MTAPTSLIRTGSAIERAPEGIASGPFWVEHLFTGERDGDLTAMRATLDPGIRTHWHSHPRGQLLLAVSGVGLLQRRGGEIVEIRAGDVVWFHPGEEHWHGASERSVLIYASIQPMQGGAAVHWLEPS
ncbi:cupin [Labrys miyagiensis]